MSFFYHSLHSVWVYAVHDTVRIRRYGKFVNFKLKALWRGYNNPEIHDHISYSTIGLEPLFSDIVNHLCFTMKLNWSNDPYKSLKQYSSTFEYATSHHTVYPFLLYPISTHSQKAVILENDKASAIHRTQSNKIQPSIKLMKTYMAISWMYRVYMTEVALLTERCPRAFSNSRLISYTCSVIVGEKSAFDISDKRSSNTVSKTHARIKVSSLLI